MAEEQLAEPVTEAALALEAAPETMALLQLFDQMDATAPLLRLVIAGGIVAVSLLLLLVSRIVTRRRTKRLERVPDGKFKPLRLQAQDLITAEDMKKLWLSVWQGFGWLFSTVFGLAALTGLLVHTTITIGYDVPWQTVNELLIAAANETSEIVGQPEPFVLQTSLDDNYVSYEVNGWTRKPEELPRIYSELHANILDQFHGRKVEITSPHYRANRDGNPSTIPEVIPREEAEPEAKV